MFHLVQHNLITRNMLNLNMKKSTHPHIWPIYQCRHSIYAVLSTHYELYSIQLQSNHIYFLLSKLVQNLAYLIFSVSLPVLFFTLPYPYLFLNRFYPLIFLYFPSLCPLRPPPIFLTSLSLQYFQKMLRSLSSLHLFLSRPPPLSLLHHSLLLISVSFFPSPSFS